MKRRPTSGLAARLLFGAGLAIGAVDPAARAEIPLSERRSSYELISAETKTMQDDDLSNPGMLWVLDGELFAQPVLKLWQRLDEPVKPCLATPLAMSDRQ